MEPLAALLLIVGCSEDLASCTELPAPAPIYESTAECERELPPAMRSHMNGYSQILAKCVALDPALEESGAELVWSIDRNGDLLASVEPYAYDMASDDRPQ